MLQPEADIRLDRLIRNYEFIQSKIDSAKVMAVVKADAYGHGVIQISESLSEAGIHGFCVALVSEIRELIHADIHNPILHLGRISADELDVYESGQVRCTINSAEDMKILEDYSLQNSIRITAHLKIDTGMGRMGICYEELDSMMIKLSDSQHIVVEGVYSHFSTAEEKNTKYRDWQLKRFKKAVAQVRKNLPKVKYFHMANSAAILTCPESHFNMVRPGISLFGVTPLGKPHDHLLPVMRMKAPVTLIKEFNKGESVGYNRQYITKKNEKIAIIQAGYADGIPVELSNMGEVEIEGNIYPIVGKVSMDLVAILCRDLEIKIGQDAIFWGSDNMNLRLETLVGKYDKMPYEFLTCVTKRVKRNYIYE